MAELNCILSEGDLEVIILYEAQTALSELVDSRLYKVLGDDDEQQVMFHTEMTFHLFLIRLVEFFAEGVSSALVSPNYSKLSIVNGLEWLCDKYPDECREVKLPEAVQAIQAWAVKESPVEIWSPTVDKKLTLTFSNYRLVNFTANAAKHGLIRLGGLLSTLNSICAKAGYCFSEHEITSVLREVVEQAEGRLLYLSTYIVELLGKVFLSLNQLIINRFEQKPTNDWREMAIPVGVTSNIFASLYGHVIFTKRFTPSRIMNDTPRTGQFLKLRYQ